MKFNFIRDLSMNRVYPTLDALRSSAKHKLPLAAETLKLFHSVHRGHRATHSEAPAGAGISGSSALMIATCSAPEQAHRRRVQH